MGRIWQCGFEMQSIATATEFTVAIGTPLIETTIKRSGNAALRTTNPTANAGFRNSHTVSTQGAFFFRFYIYVVSFPNSATASIGGARLSGGNKLLVRLTSGGALQLINQEDGLQLGSDSSAISLDTWYRIEMMYDSTTLASTSCEARAYADTPGNVTPFWTASGTSDWAATPTNWGCYCISNDTALDIIWDDVALNDSTGTEQNSWCGEGSIIHLRPDGNGDNSGWTGSDGNSTDNYLLVDELTPNGVTDYVQSNTSGQIDDYTLAATPAALTSTDTITAVLVGVQAAVDNATGSDPDITLRIKASPGGTVAESASLDVNAITYNCPAPQPSSPPDIYRLVTYFQPDGVTRWTKSALDSAQVGVRESATDTHFARVSAIWASVDYKPTLAKALPPFQKHTTYVWRTNR